MDNKEKVINMPQKETLGDVNFIKVMDELKKLHKDYTTIRFGSLIQMAMDHKKRKLNSNLNDVSSKELLASLNEFRDNLKNRGTNANVKSR